MRARRRSPTAGPCSTTRPTPARLRHKPCPAVPFAAAGCRRAMATRSTPLRMRAVPRRRALDANHQSARRKPASARRQSVRRSSASSCTRPWRGRCARPAGLSPASARRRFRDRSRCRGSVPRYRGPGRCRRCASSVPAPRQRQRKHERALQPKTACRRAPPAPTPTQCENGQRGQHARTKRRERERTLHGGQHDAYRQQGRTQIQGGRNDDERADTNGARPSRVTKRRLYLRFTLVREPVDHALTRYGSREETFRRCLRPAIDGTPSCRGCSTLPTRPPMAGSS